MELYVDLDRELAARYGVPLNQPAEVVSLTFRGRRLQRFRTPTGEREMRLTLDERENESVSQLHNLPVWTADGDKIPLASMAEFRIAPGPERIQRDNRRTSVWVGARYDEGTMDDYLPLVRTAMDSMDFPSATPGPCPSGPSASASSRASSWSTCCSPSCWSSR